MGYISHFIVYVLAMISVIGLALFVYKKFSVMNFSNTKSNSMKIEETLNLTPRKTLYVVNVDGEKFLIAGDLERTTLISKLENHKTPVREIKDTGRLNDFIKNEDVLYASSKEPVMKNLVKKLEIGIK